MQEHDPTAPLPAPALEGLPRRLRGRLAALSVLGALVVALPLGQVLRYQSAEMELLAAQREGLNPVTRAVDVQRGLLAHRDTTAEVLGGDQRMEPERRVRQAEVDERLAYLAVALTTGPWDRAVRESDALRDDWLLLSRDLMAGRVEAAESEQAHRLLVEQTLQVLDLLADASTPRAQRQGGDGTAMAWSAALALPRLLAQVAALPVTATAGDTLASGRELIAAEARLARTLGSLNTALERPQTHPAPGAAALAEAGARAGAAADQYFQRLRTPSTGSTDLRQAANAALQAQFALFDGVAAATRHGIDERLAEIAQRRRLLLAALGVLSLSCLLLVLQLARGLRALDRPPVPPPATPSPTSDRMQAQRLMQRLRQGEDDNTPGRQGADAEAAPAAAPQPTLPPEH